MNSESLGFEQFHNQMELEPISDEKSDDVFLACASYEDRSTAVIESLTGSYSAKHGIIYVNEEFLSGEEGEDAKELVNDNLSKMKDTLNDYCGNIHVAKGSWLNPGEQLTGLKSSMDYLNDVGEKPLQVTIDTTTFNREALMVTLNLLYNRFNDLETRVIYVSAENYGEWLSRGNRQIRNVLGFGGLHQSTKPTVLIILSGFEKIRALNIIEEFEPAKVLLGHGDPPIDEEFLDENIETSEGIIEKMVLSRQELEEFSFPANNIYSSFIAIEQLIVDHSPTKNVVVAPMSTKLSTIGVWLAARNHFETQVTYAIPGEYNISDYSQGMGETYIEFLPR